MTDAQTPDRTIRTARHTAPFIPTDKLPGHKIATLNRTVIVGDDGEELVLTDAMRWRPPTGAHDQRMPTPLGILLASPRATAGGAALGVTVLAVLLFILIIGGR